jgi:myo-inositol-1(or 4)-monophosphatase
MMKDLLVIAERAAREAGALLRDNFGKLLTIEKKADQSLVTDIDKRAEKTVVDIIRSVWPGHTIIGEESGKSQPNGEYTWVIDPIDGTHNFIRGMKNFGVSIGIIRGQEFVAGVIYLPCEDVLYKAELGSGSFKNSERIHVSHLSCANECTLLFDSGFKIGYNEKIEVFKKVAPQMFNVRMFGASVRNLTYIAEGVADVLLEFDDKLWDYAAGITLVKEAGGVVTDFEGNVLTPDSCSYVASNGFVHESIQKMIK